MTVETPIRRQNDISIHAPIPEEKQATERSPTLLESFSPTPHKPKKDKYVKNSFLNKDSKNNSPEKTPLEKDVYLDEFIKEQSYIYNDPEKYINGAELALKVIIDLGGSELNANISPESIELLKQKIKQEEQRRIALNLDTEWYVQMDSHRVFRKERNNEQIRRNVFEDSLSYTCSQVPELPRILGQFDDNPIYSGEFTVLTLKQMEANRQQESRPQVLDVSRNAFVPKEIPVSSPRSLIG